MSHLTIAWQQEAGMEIKEFGTQNERVVVLVHPSLVTWDYF